LLNLSNDLQRTSCRTSKLNEEQLNQDVAIWDEDNDEFYQQDVDLLFVDDTDVLDVGHPIIRF